MVKKGSKVRVVKGRKVPIGTTGYVVWSGTTQYGERLGIKLDPKDRNEEPAWTAADNVEVLVEGTGPEREDGEPDAATKALREERDALRRELYDLRRVAKTYGDERDALRRQVMAMQGEIDALRAETKVRVAPVLDEAYLVKVAKFAAQGAEDAIRIALRTQLAPQDHEVEQAKIAKATAPEAAPRAPLALDPAPQVDEDGIEILSEAEKERRNKVTDAVLAPATKPAQLAKCPKCGTFKFKIGTHECSKA